MQQIQRRIFYALILIAGLAWIGISADPSGRSTGASVSAPQVGFPAPDFSLKTPDGKAYTLSDLRGQAILINLWATWCPPCRAEMPAIQRLYEEYRAQGFIVLAVNSTIQDDPLAIAPFVKEYALTFPILLDETGEFSRSYEIRSLPSSYFVNRDGTINELVIGGPMSVALLRTRIEEILK
jgi:cytochrome c biogenesis protein CcmG, thiol:disulfide interchange protein DsbE